MASKSSSAASSSSGITVTSNKKQKTALFQTTSSTPFDRLPHSISTAYILSYLTRDEWFNLRLASRSCYEIVHGTTNVFHSYCPLCERESHHSDHIVDTSYRTDESEALWTNLLIEDFYFGSPVETTRTTTRTTTCDETPSSTPATLSSASTTKTTNGIYESIHSPLNEQYGPFLSTKNKFTAAHAFTSWKHWKKIDLRLNSGREPNAYIHPCQRLIAPHFLRAAKLWTTIERWCHVSGDVGRSIRGSLKPGIAFDHFMPHGGGAFHSRARVSALKAVYSFYAGQYRPEYWEDGAYHGLFGCVSSDAFNCVMHWAEPYFGVFHDHSDRTGELTIAYESWGDFSRQRIFLDLASGQLVCDDDFYATPTLKENVCTTTSDGNPLEYTTESLIKPEESLLVFFEEYARRLQCGYYSIDKFPNNLSDNQSILAYPSLVDGCHCSRAVTRGVEVIASSVSVMGRCFFLYSVRFRLLIPDDGDEYPTTEERGFDTCQLLSHHWKITKEKKQFKQSLDSTIDTMVEEINGEGVFRMGQWSCSEHPLLEEGGFQEFLKKPGINAIVRPSILDEQYDSDDDEKKCFSNNIKGYFFHQGCVETNSRSIEGVLQFVPGSLLQPKGDMFEVRVAPVNFDHDPGFVYI